MNKRKGFGSIGLGGVIGLALLLAFCLLLPTAIARAVETTGAGKSTASTTETAAAQSTNPDKTTAPSGKETTASRKTTSAKETTEPTTEAPKKDPFPVLFKPFGYEDITKDQPLVIVTGALVNIREKAGTGADILAIARKGQVLTQLGSAKDKNGVVWYKVLAEGEEDTAEGYISSAMSRSATLSAKGDIYANYLKLLGFPDSYIPQLKTLHERYPNWVFTATNTGLDWNNSVYEEANPAHYIGLSLIHNNPGLWPNSYKAMEHDNFSWAANDFKTIYDGPDWTLASTKLVAYYLDPRNFLKEDGIFQFLNLLYDETQTVAGVQAIVKNTFMADGSHVYGESFSYPELLVSVGRDLGISPYYLAASIKQEIGAGGGSKSISGTSTTVTPRLTRTDEQGNTVVTNGGGTLLTGYYNYYNVYAYTMMGMDANDVGLWFAAGQDTGQTSFLRPWNTREKAIRGGAMFHAYNYLRVGQNTLYYKRFNVVGGDGTVSGGTYRHQYMTNIMGAYSESRHLSAAYDAVARGRVLCFDIPVYDNMPATGAPIPTSDPAAYENLNPNNRLASLKAPEAVSNPKVTVDAVSYAMAVKSDTIQLTATPIDSGARVSGDGTLKLKEGENVLTLTVTAANGDRRDYQLNIFCAPKEDSVFSMDYRSSEGYWSGILPGTSVADFRKNVTLTEGATLTVLDSAGKMKEEAALISTGDRVRIYAPNGALYSYATCLIYGDVNGDGEIDIFDLVVIRNYLIKMKNAELNNIQLMVADVSRDGEVDIFDLVAIRNSILRFSSIEQ